MSKKYKINAVKYYAMKNQLQSMQEQIDELLKDNMQLAKDIDMWNSMYNDVFDENRLLKWRNDKAIEYIEYNLKSFLYGIEYRTLIKILKGGSND